MVFNTKRGTKIVILLVFVTCLVTPVLAGTRYINGTPDLVAYVAGTNSYVPGADIEIPVVIQNIGISTNYETGPDIPNRPDIPMTAKFVTVAMEPGDAPLVIKSDPHMIGDIPSESQMTATFSAKVNADAAGGTYLIPLNVTYTQFTNEDLYLFETFRTYYTQENETLYVPVTIKARAIPEVVSATTEGLVAGESGYLNLTLRNVGSLDGTNATAQILQDDNSLVTPVDSSVFIGDFPAGGTISCKYKINVSTDALSKSYPVDIEVNYQDNTGTFVTSSPITTGVTVGSKVDFEILSQPAVLYPGSRNTVQVAYKNTGVSMVYGAYARITVYDPFTSSMDLVYLGDIAPGQTVVAPFQLSVASDATLKEYGMDSEIRYTDAIDDAFVSQPISVLVDVQNPTGIMAIVSNPQYISVIAILLVVMLMAIRRIGKK